jgi:hypothetical protein
MSIRCLAVTSIFLLFSLDMKILGRGIDSQCINVVLVLFEIWYKDNTPGIEDLGCGGFFFFFFFVIILWSICCHIALD